MSRVYLIKPLHKKSICWMIELFRDNADGSTSWVNIEDHYRWGQGFVEYDADVNLPYEGQTQAYAKTNFGWGSELEDGVACYFEYSDDFTDEQKEAFETAYHEGGAGWLFDGEHDWQVEDDYLLIDAPFQVSLCEEDGTVIEENVKLRAKPNPSTSWPFSEAFPKPDSEGGETD
jgi:hypothetical protein